MTAPMQQRKTGLVVIAVWVCLAVISCSPRPAARQPPQPTAFQAAPQAPQPPQQVQPDQPPGAPQPQQAPAQPVQPQPPAAGINLVGIWESQIMTDYGVMYTQMILQPNGSYSYQVILGDLMTWEVGTYQVVADQNFIHFTLEDYGPTTYKGTQLSRPTSWGVFYTVVDGDTMIWEDRVLGTQWTVHRRR
jgi:hypothetical protein